MSDSTILLLWLALYFCVMGGLIYAFLIVASSVKYFDEGYPISESFSKAFKDYP